jgi:NAD(P)-dependent dehydrogenase (short-subunit alcohol dehydrogenase family)
MLSDIFSIYNEPTPYAYHDPKDRQDRKVAIVTGANGEVGYYVCLHLYMHGWVVYATCRNPDRGLEAIEKMKQEAEERKQSLPDNAVLGEIILGHVDLSYLYHIKEFVENFSKHESKVDLLINNAGALSLPAVKTPYDDIEVQLQVNHVGPFLLTHLLLDHLSESPEPRVVNVSSIAHFFALPGISLDSSMSWPSDFVSGSLRYARAKQCVIQSTRIFAEQYPNVFFLSVHPGFIPSTRLYRQWASTPIFGPLIRGTMSILSTMNPTPEQGSYPILYAGLSSQLSPLNDNGRYLHVGSFLTDSETSARYVWEWTVNVLKERGYL